MTEKIDVMIRAAGDKDIPALYDFLIDLKAGKNTGYFERCLELQAQDKRLLLIAEKEGAIAGYGILNWAPKYGFYKRFNIPEIQDLNVAHDLRRHGIATQMIEHCEDLARQRGAEEIGISFGLHSTYGPAQRLYIKMGYIPDGNGVTYDRKAVNFAQNCPVDDDLCLMLVKSLKA